jgi:uncharacterized protein YeaC (DUF1315 family)
MDIIQLVENLSEEMYQRLKHATETGKWPEGTVVDQAQRASAMQIVMAYQAKMLKSDQMMTVGENGEIVTKTKQELKAQFSQATKNEQTSTDTSDPQSIARFSQL